MSQHIWLRRFLLGGIAFILLSFSYLFTLTAYGTSVQQKPFFKTNIISDAKLSCPGMPAPQAGADPSLTICSPAVDGNTAGAFGSHIVVSIGNLSGPPTNWLLVNNNIFINTPLHPNDIQQCIAKRVPGCLPLPNAAQTTKISSTQTLYGWTWAAPDFPNNLDGFHFYAVVGPISDDNIIYNTPPFTLLSSEPPCITVDDGNGNTTICNTNQSLQVVHGSSVTLHGSNWLLRDKNNKSPKQTIIINAVCVSNPAIKCSQPSYPLASAQTDAMGSFTQQVQLPANLTGNYMITATNQVTDTANGALTVGAPGDTVNIVLSIPVPARVPAPIHTHTPTPTPHPSGSISIDWVDASGLILTIPSVLAILLYIILWLWWRFTRAARAQSIDSQINPNQGAAPILIPKSDKQPWITSLFFKQPKALLVRRAEPLSEQEAVQSMLQGDMQPIIVLGIYALQFDDDQWSRLLQAVHNISKPPAKNLVQSVMPINTTGKKEDLSLEERCRRIIVYEWRIRFVKKPKASADVWFIIGNLYKGMTHAASPNGVDQQQKASDAYFKASDYYKEDKKAISGQISALCAIGSIYLNYLTTKLDQNKQAYTELALRYYDDALEICSNKKDKKGSDKELAVVLSHVAEANAEVYRALGEEAYKQKAAEYYKNAITILQAYPEEHERIAQLKKNLQRLK